MQTACLLAYLVSFADQLLWSATSVPLDSGYIVVPRRNRLADNSVEAMLLARCNRDLLDWYLVVVHWSGLLKKHWWTVGQLD